MKKISKQQFLDKISYWIQREPTKQELEFFWSSYNKDFRDINIMAWITKCIPKDGFSVGICKTCMGTGKVKQYMYLLSEEEEICPDCRGKGKIR